MKPKPKQRTDKIQIPMRITTKDHVRFRKVMKERHVEYETQLARMIVLEYLDKYFEEKK